MSINPRGRPPFRADHIGSLLRPPALRQAFRQHAAGEISDGEFARVQDECIRAAGSELVATLDGDLQNDPRDIFTLLERYFAEPDRESVGLLIGHRVQRRDSRTRRLASRFANGLRSRVLHDATPDTGCGIKVVRRSVFLELPYFDHMHRFLPALTQRAGYRVRECVITTNPGSRLLAAALNATARVRWCEIFSC